MILGFDFVLTAMMMGDGSVRQSRVVDTYVGLFILLAIARFSFLAFKVSGLTESLCLWLYIDSSFDTIWQFESTCAC